MTLETTTMTSVEVQAYLDELLQIAGLDESGNGLIVAGRSTIGKVGLAVNCSVQAIEQAIQRGCDLLITHHAAWRSTDAYLSEQKYDQLRELGISLYVAHDSLDNARDFGTADALARGVRVAIQGPFQPDGESQFGVHGVTTGGFPDFVTRVGNQLGMEPRAWRNTDSFGHVAIVAGWGARPEWMARAQALGCDTFLSGEAIFFGILFAKEAGLNLVLAGHYATEVPGVMALGARIARDLHLDVTFIPEEILEARR
jgi:dinuclear metal center YbgI/SA1388 family protein